MATGTGGGKPQQRRTDFESMTHQQLVALIASANPTGASNLASRLSQASSTITSIGEDIRAYVTGLPWHGEGGDAFRAWGGQMASTTLRLGEYSRGASQWMEEVAQAIGEAKAAMPPISETTRAQNALTKANGTYETATDPANRNDPDARGLARTAQSDAAAAEARIDVLRGEAALRLRKLAQTYEFTAHQVNAKPPPTFPPPAAFMGGWRGNRPKGQASSGEVSPARPVLGGGPVGSARSVSGGDHGPSVATSVSRDPMADLPLADASGLSSQPPRVEPPTRMEIDGLATLPTAMHPSPSTSPVVPPSIGTSEPLGVQPMPTPAASGAGSVKKPWQPAPPVTGRPGPTGGRLPGLPIQGPTGPGASARLPHDTGIVGGRPTSPATGTGRGMPRGLVVGGEGTAGTRGPMGMGHSSGMGSGSGGARPGASGGGGRYASQAGGIVAGNPRQANRPGVPPIVGGGAMARPNSKTPSGRRDERGSERPAYLVEDEETWKQNGRRIVPPVVD